MKRTLTIIAIASSLFTAPALAQPPGGGDGPPPQIRAAMEKNRPIFELMGSVSLILELDKQKGLEVTKDQAKKLLPILKDLGSRTALKPEDADKILVNIEDNILSDKQVTWLDDERLRRGEEARKRAQQAQGNGPRPFGPGGFGGPGGQPNPQAQAMFQAMMQGKPFNPFKGGPGEEPLKKLIGLLEKRV